MWERHTFTLKFSLRVGYGQTHIVTWERALSCGRGPFTWEGNPSMWETHTSTWEIVSFFFALRPLLEVQGRDPIPRPAPVPSPRLHIGENKRIP